MYALTEAEKPHRLLPWSWRLWTGVLEFSPSLKARVPGTPRAGEDPWLSSGHQEGRTKFFLLLPLCSTWALSEWMRPTHVKEGKSYQPSSGL